VTEELPLDPRRLARLVFGEIAQGYSTGKFKDTIVYIKHFSQKDFGLLELEYEKGYREAQKSKLPTIEEKKKILIQSGDWSEEEEERYEYISKKLENIDTQLSQIFLKSQKKHLETERFKVKEEYDKLKEGRNLLEKNSCEDYANKKYAESIAAHSLFKDKNFEIPLHSEEELDAMSAKAYIEIVKFFNERTQHLTDQNIKRVAVSPYFLNTFIYSKNIPINVFGRPSVELTVNQTNLFLTAIKYKDILEKGKSPPEYVYKDIDSLVNWYEGTTPSNPEAAKENSKMSAENQSSALVGATKEELQDYANATGGVVVDLKKELDEMKEKKGKVGAAEFAEIFDKYK